MNQQLNLSSGPHARTSYTTAKIMMIVTAALLPATIVGIAVYGLPALILILTSVIAAVATEAIFCLIVKKPLTIRDGSAVVTGLLLALSLSPATPAYLAALGSIFAIFVAKCCFGGIGKNFINPALAGRCFLLISFGSSMTNFEVDGVSQATPLALLKSGEAVNIMDMFLGTSNAVVGSSVLALLVGGLALWLLDIIHGEICWSILISFSAVILLFGGHGFDPAFLAAHLAGGGVVMGAFFMATDYTTSPVSKLGQAIYGITIGVVGAVFRILGNGSDSFSYSVIFANLLTPLIDHYIISTPYAYRKSAIALREGPMPEKKGIQIPKPVVTLSAITLLAGVALGGVFFVTKDTIEEQKMLANTASYKTVLADAETFELDDAASAAIDALGGETYGDAYGRVKINSALVGKDAAGETVGYVVSVTTSDGYDGDVTLTLGVDKEGKTTGIAFTELNETPGMGMRAGEEEFMSQFADKEVDSFILNKAGNGTTPEEIDSISGASITSGAVVNAVNAGLDFLRNNLLGGA